MNDAGRPPLTQEQRSRLHRLADLGGLVTIAELDTCPPDLLLGALLELAAHLARLPEPRIEQLRHRGRTRLDARAAEKRAWKSWHQAQNLHRLDLTTSEITHIATRLGGTTAPRPATAVAQLLNMIRPEPTCETPETN